MPGMVPVRRLFSTDKKVSLGLSSQCSGMPPEMLLWPMLKYMSFAVGSEGSVGKGPVSSLCDCVVDVI